LGADQRAAGDAAGSAYRGGAALPPLLPLLALLLYSSLPLSSGDAAGLRAAKQRFRFRASRERGAASAQRRRGAQRNARVRTHRARGGIGGAARLRRNAARSAYEA